MPIAYRYSAWFRPPAECGWTAGKRRLLVCTSGFTVSPATRPRYANGCAAMASSANRSARVLLAGVNAAVSGTDPELWCRHCHAPWFHR